MTKGDRSGGDWAAFRLPLKGTRRATFTPMGRCGGGGVTAGRIQRMLSIRKTIPRRPADFGAVLEGRAGAHLLGEAIGGDPVRVPWTRRGSWVRLLAKVIGGRVRSRSKDTAERRSEQLTSMFSILKRILRRRPSSAAFVIDTPKHAASALIVRNAEEVPPCGGG